MTEESQTTQNGNGQSGGGSVMDLIGQFVQSAKSSWDATPNGEHSPGLLAAGGDTIGFLSAIAAAIPELGQKIGPGGELLGEGLKTVDHAANAGHDLMQGDKTTALHEGLWAAGDAGAGLAQSLLDSVLLDPDRGWLGNLLVAGEHYMGWTPEHFINGLLTAALGPEYAAPKLPGIAPSPAPVAAPGTGDVASGAGNSPAVGSDTASTSPELHAEAARLAAGLNGGAVQSTDTAETGASPLRTGSWSDRIAQDRADRSRV